jgi:hypothetical protein
VTHAGVDEITAIDGSTDTVEATFSIGSEAREIVFDVSSLQRPPPIFAT